MATHISFTPNRELPFMFGDLFQISSKLSYYRLGGIQQIQSVISGQYAENKTIHEETTQSEWFEEQERLSERESSRLESTHEGMQQALSETVASSQKFGASAEAEVNYGVVRAAVAMSYDNDKSKTQSKTDATDFAHDVVEQSRELVRERTLSSRRQSTNVLDRTESVRGFDNRGGASSAFITRFVEEAHEFSLVQHEAHLFTRFFLPFPAANYLNAAEAGRTKAAVGRDDPAKLSYVDPKTKKNVTLSPEEISTDDSKPTHWFKLAAIFGLTDPTPPPEELAEIVTIKIDHDQLIDTSLFSHNSVKVPEGYVPNTVTVIDESNVPWIDGTKEHFEYHVVLLVGQHKFWIKAGSGNIFGTALNIPVDVLYSGELPFVLRVARLGVGSYSLYFRFKPTLAHANEWKLQFFDELRKAQTGQGAEPDMMAAVTGVQVADLRSSPTAAKKVIDLEIQRASLQYLLGTDFWGLDAVDRAAKSFPDYPVMDVAKANSLQPILDFLFNGFEFDKMSRRFLPHFLGGREQRESAFAGGATGELSEFLTASAAEIVLPVRHGREEQLFFFLRTGIIFGGSDVPLPDDPVTLALYQEILDARALNESPESIVIDTWEEYLPTPHVILQAGATMPDWRSDGVMPGAVEGNELAPQKTA